MELPFITTKPAIDNSNEEDEEISKSVNTDERRALEFLTVSNLGTVVFEPNGPKTPPDFSIAGRIAVEVTRLNQNVVTPSGVQGLETARISLKNAFHEFVHGFMPKCPILPDEPSWYVSYAFRRPVQKWSSVEPVLRSILQAFANGNRECREYKINSRFNISLHKAGKRYDTFFRQGGFVDRDSGGFVIPEMKANVSVCLERKSSLLASLLSYSERWLILVDHVSFGSWDPFETEAVGWDRLLILNPEGPMRSYEPGRKIITADKPSLPTPR